MSGRQVCQWCGQPVPAGKATWWDGRPQCPDPHACDRRIEAARKQRESSRG